jgi:hypothetical protein
MLRKICRSGVLRMYKRCISQHNTPPQNGKSSSVDAHEKISYPYPERQITAAF